MKNQFVTYEIAKKLKELGFNEPCLAGYTDLKDEILLEGIDHCENDLRSDYKNSAIKTDFEVTAPLWQQCLDWLRNTKEIYVTERMPAMGVFSFWIENGNDRRGSEVISGSDRDKTFEAAVLKALELIKIS